MELKQLEEIIENYANLDDTPAEDCICLLYHYNKLAKYILDKLNETNIH